jgi:hypothetical protein
MRIAQPLRVLLALAALACAKADPVPPSFPGPAEAAAPPASPAPAPTADAGSACRTADDCRLFDDYCTGCDCRALAKDDPDPKCSGPGVRCLRQPCADKVAACVKGRCTVSDKPR